MAETCRVCGADLPIGAPRGHCPICLLRLALPGKGTAEQPVQNAEPEARYFGDYELLERIAAGGQGVVYRARQIGLERLVALKLPNVTRAASPEFLERFRREGEVTASLEHANIVPLYEAGECEGRPYLAMKWVEGDDLGQWIQGVRGDPPGEGQAGRTDEMWGRIARLMIKVAGAIDYAHQHGVLHRDLKPGNILVDRQEEPFLTDFGLAKVLELEGNLTQSLNIIGTPNYLAPELASGGARHSTIAVDVYGLGAVLYHLLTGRPPFSANSPVDTLRLLLDSEPMRPRAIDTQVPADLEAICLKALSRAPERRYASARAMGEDLARFARKEPVLARPITRRERLARWAERNPVAAFLSGLIAFLALALLAGTPWALWRISAEANRALQRAEEATEQRGRAEANLRQQQVARIEMLFHTDHAMEGIAELGRLFAQHPRDARLAAWIANELTHRNFALPLMGPFRHDDRVCLVRFSPDGQRLLTASHRNAAQVWDIASGRALGPPLQHPAELARAEDFRWGNDPIYAEFSPDGRWVATASVDNTAQIWDAETGQRRIGPLGHPHWVTFVRFSPDGKLLATACRDGIVRLWDAGTGQRRGKDFQHEKWANTVVFSPDGERLLTASDDNTARVWEVATGKAITEPLRHERGVRAAVFTSDGRTVATASADGTARIWDAATGVPRIPPLAHGGQLTVIQFSPDGRWLAAGGFDRSVRIWRVADGSLQCPPLRHAGVVRALDFSPDGFRMVTASEDRTARVWDVRSGTPLTESLRHDDVVWSACFSPDGRSVATASWDRSVFVWDVRPGKAIPLVMPAGAKVRGVQWLHQGHELLTITDVIFLHDADSGRMICRGPLRAGEPAAVAVASPRGSRVLIATREGNAAIWDMETGKQETPRISLGGPLAWAALSPDEKLVATASPDGKVRLWDTLTGREARPPLIHSSPVVRVEFSPDGRTLATACGDFTVWLWDAGEGKQVSAPLSHPARIEDLVFSPDGRSLATASRDGAARIWDATTGRMLCAPMRHRAPVVDVDFSPDGRHLVTASRDGSARVWLAATGQPLAKPIAPGPAVLDATFSADGQWLALGCDDGHVAVWDTLASQPLLTSLRHPAVVTVCQFSPTGPRLATGAGDHQARIWDLMTATGAAPGWLPDVVKAVVGGEAESMEGAARESHESFQAFRSRMLSLPATDDWGRWLHWFLADRAKRNISPLADRTVDSLVLDRLDRGDIASRANFEDLVEAIWLQPSDGQPYSQAAMVLASPALAGETDRLATVERLSRRGLELSPNTFRGNWARAVYLDLAGDQAGATVVLERIISLGSDNLYFWLWSTAYFEKTGQKERGAFALSKAVEVGDRLPWWVERRPELHQMQAEYLRRHGLAR